MILAFKEFTAQSAAQWKEIDKIRHYIQQYKRNWLSQIRNKKLKAHYGTRGTYRDNSVYIGRYTVSITFRSIRMPDPVIAGMARAIHKLFGYASIQQGSNLRIYMFGGNR